MSLTTAKLSTLRGYDCDKLKQRRDILKSKISTVKAASALAREIEKTEKALMEKRCRIIPTRITPIRVRPTPPRRPVRAPPIRVRRPARMPEPRPIPTKEIEKCPRGILTPEISVDKDFKIRTSLHDHMKRGMEIACPLGPEGNKCVADHVMRFRGILKKNKGCLSKNPTVQYAPMAERLWKENKEAGKEDVKIYEQGMKEWEKTPWATKPIKPVMLTIPQQKNIDMIKGKKPLI